MKVLMIASFMILFAQVANADQSVGQVRQAEYVTASVVHDTTMRTAQDLSAAESYFLSTVPYAEGLRDAVCEMLLANVVHVPKWKVYRKGDSTHYWAIYQAWTGPAKVKIPVIRGLDGQDGRNGQDGRPGQRGPRGRQGPKGDQGTPGTGVTNYYFGAPAQMMSGQIGGQYAPIVNNNQLASMSVTPASRINISVNANGSVGPITNNNANSNVNSNANNNAINIGPGSASGSATGTGTGTAQAGSNRK